MPDNIIEGAKEVLRESETGMLLIQAHETHSIPIHVIKGDGDAGFSPETKVIYLQIPGNMKVSDPKVVIAMIKGLREADQELIGFTAPDPAKDLLQYAAAIHAKNVDSIIYICKVVKELTKSSLFPVLLDTLTEIGYGNLYKAYENGASQEEMYDIYAET